MSWIVSLPKRCPHAKYSLKPLEYVRNYTSVHTECIKVLSRDRQVGRRDIRSLAAAAVPSLPFLFSTLCSLFLSLPPLPLLSLSLFHFLAKEQNFLSIRMCLYILIYILYICTYDCTAMYTITAECPGKFDIIKENKKSLNNDTLILLNNFLISSLCGFVIVQNWFWKWFATREMIVNLIHNSGAIYKSRNWRTTRWNTMVHFCRTFFRTSFLAG